MAVYNIPFRRSRLPAARVWGVCWDYGSPSTALTRLTPDTDPQHFTTETVSVEPEAAVGDGPGSSVFDNFMPWSGMEEYNIIDSTVACKQGETGFSRTEYDTVVYIPEFWYAVRDDAANQRRYWYIADGRKRNFDRHPGSGRYVARYICGDGYASRSGLTPAVDITLEQSIQGIRERGDGWYIYDYKTFCAIVLLYLVEFADWDSQAKLGLGFLASPPCNAGDTDSMFYHTGHVSGEKNKEAMQYRHIENLFGGAREYIGGILEKQREAVYLCENPDQYGITLENYVSTGAALPGGWDFISRLHMVERFPWAFLPQQLGGSEKTYIPDHVWIPPGRDGISTFVLSGLPGEIGYPYRNGILVGCYGMSTTTPDFFESTRIVFDPALITKI